MTQPYPLREQLKALEHLQELDLKIENLKKRKAALPAALKSLDDSFRKIRTTVETRKSALGEIEKVQKQTQAALELNKDRLARANSKLETVQNSQEFQAANKEIDQLKKLNTTLEEQLKKSKLDTDSGNKDLETLGAELEKVKAELDAQTATVNTQVGELDGEISNLLQERGKYTPTIERRILSQYDRVRGARAGVGFVPAIGGRCSGCNMMVPPQLFNEVQKATAVHSCPSCHRILFVPASGQPSQGAPQATSSAS